MSGMQIGKLPESHIQNHITVYKCYIQVHSKSIIRVTAMCNIFLFFYYPLFNKNSNKTSSYLKKQYKKCFGIKRGTSEYKHFYLHLKFHKNNFLIMYRAHF